MENNKKTENLTEYYSPEYKFIFREFDGEYHGHFDALYGKIGISAPSFGGNEKGALYVTPIKIIGEDRIVCELNGRGLFAEYKKYVNILSICAVIFYGDDGLEVDTSLLDLPRESLNDEQDGSTEESNWNYLNDREHPDLYRVH